MDWKLASAIALVDLVNVPSTFVSSNPYYVVNQTKQIKPFILLVSGMADDGPAAPGNAISTAGESCSVMIRIWADRPRTAGKLYKW